MAKRSGRCGAAVDSLRTVHGCRHPLGLADLQIVLIALTRQPRSCREIAAIYEQHFRDTIANGTLYLTLRRLADRGLIKDFPGPSLRVRWYVITEAGAEALEGASRHILAMSSVLAAESPSLATSPTR